jgi:hypothetical protein
VSSGQFGGRPVDGRPALRTRQDTVDELKHIAKVRVADSNPSSALEISSSSWADANGTPGSVHFFLPITAHQLPITGQGWGAMDAAKGSIISGGSDSFELRVYGGLIQAREGVAG